MQHSPCKN